jgi:hypothetical protein
MLYLAAACSSSSSAVERATIGSLAFDAPGGWTRRDLSTHQRAMVEWRPADHEREESVAVVRVERPALAKGKDSQLERLLQEAQANLPRGTFGQPARFSTKHGLWGVRIEGELVQPGQTVPVHRLHAVLVEGTALVHVIYTARELDREAFELVVDSMRRGG